MNGIDTLGFVLTTRHDKMHFNNNNLTLDGPLSQACLVLNLILRSEMAAYA